MDQPSRSKLETAWNATLGAGSRGMMKAAGGLTLRRGDSSASPGPSKLLSISVVGLSGGEKEKGSAGTGKSCLINRFIQPRVDNYSVDHISCFSQSDFCGRVVNNDHFLYWGDTLKVNEEGTEFHIQVIEQTEFTDDASFTPFRGSGKYENYIKRCCITKLLSPEKIAYICKEQLGIEREFEQKPLPEGRFNVDGFLVLFDVSYVPNRSLEKCVEITAGILTNVMKTKKPVVLVASKCDDADELIVREVEKLVNRKEFKNMIPVVEVSSHENINVDQAFFTLAQMIDRTRGRSRIISYYEAASARRESLELISEAYIRLLGAVVCDYGLPWNSVLKKINNAPEYIRYVITFGSESAIALFNKHNRKLKDDYLGAKVQRYLDILPEVLIALIPDFDFLAEEDWDSLKVRLRNHPDFDHWFVQYPEDTTWMEVDLFNGDSSENRIPADILSMGDAESVFKNHLSQMHTQQKRLELPMRFRKDFKHLLEEMGCITPGKSIKDVRVLFLGRECFENLPEKDIIDIYDLHQKEITLKAKKNFQELLLERSDLFYQFRCSPAGTITQDDISEITELLSEDSRYKNLDRLDADRKLLLYQHLGFVHAPMREHCRAYPNCYDNLIDKILAQKHVNSSSFSRNERNINLLVLGTEIYTHELVSILKERSREPDFLHNGSPISLQFRPLSGDVSLPENAFRTQDFLPHGCLCTFSNYESFEYIRHSLEKTLLSNLEHEDKLPFQGLSLLITFRADSSSEVDNKSLREEGRNLAESLHCPFMDLSEKENRGDSSSEEEALHSLIDAILHQNDMDSFINKNVCSFFEPDIRVLLCVLCGDPFSVESLLSPLLTAPIGKNERSVSLEMSLGDSQRRVQVLMSSYHGADEFRDELLHGFILVYSTKRKASLATLSAFSMNVPELPIQILAINDGNLSNTTNSTSCSSNNSSSSTLLPSLLIGEGRSLAERLNASFVNISTIHHKISIFSSFFKEVWHKKSEIESAFTLENDGRLYDSGEGTLERPLKRLQPLPPPRLDSYRRSPPSNPSHSGSGSEVYERLPRLGGSLEDPSFEDTLQMSDEEDEEEEDEEDSDLYSQLDSIDRKNGATEHLIKPSIIKNKKRSSEFETLPPFPPRPSFFKNPSSHVPKESHKSNNSKSRLPSSSTSSLLTRNFKNDVKQSKCHNNNNNDSSFFQNRGFEGFPSPDTPPEPAPPDPNDPRSSSRRLLKASTIPSSSKNPSNESSLDKDGSPYFRRDEQGVYTSERRRPPPPIKPRSQNIPGRLNMSDFDKITAALTSMQSSSRRLHAPLATSEDSEHGGGYAIPSDSIQSEMSLHYASPLDELLQVKLKARNRRENNLNIDGSGSETSESSSEESKNLNSAHRVHKRSKKKRSGAIPVPTPKVPSSRPFVKVKESGDGGPSSQVKNNFSEPPTSLSSPQRDENVCPHFNFIKDQERQRKKWDKESKQKQKEDDRRKLKDEKKRIKEESRNGRKRDGGKSGKKPCSLEDFKASPDNPIPLFLEKALAFIEKEGLDSEGLYRVPGNRSHVDLLFQKFDEDPSIDIYELDIAVNGVATAVKDFFCKRLPPILEQEAMDDLDLISSMADRSIRTLELSKLLKRLPPTNFAVLKYIFQHFVRVTELSKDNCMDSKNLAICWWPTLLQYQFEDLGKFEAVRPHMEEITQTMIDQFPFLFCGQEEVMMV